MSLRPRPARWFEVLAVREDVPTALAALAGTGAVELEVQGETAPPFSLEELQPGLAAYHRLAERYGRYWPAADTETPTARQSPVDALGQAVKRLDDWADEASPHIDRLEALSTEHEDLRALWEMLTAADAPGLDARLLRAGGTILATRLYVLPTDAEPEGIPDEFLVRAVEGSARRFLIVTGPREAFARAEDPITAVKGRRITPPEWLQGPPAAAVTAITRRLEQIAVASREQRQALTELAERCGTARALGQLVRLEWFVTHVERLALTSYFAWITGWSSDLDGRRLQAALGSCGARALLKLADPPPDTEPPLVLHNPWWIRPFELFAGLLGTPGRAEADPSTLLAVVAPLMFGYMFGDVGQGLVLCAVGIALRHRLPALRLLIPGGLLAALFGLAFGSVFSLEHVIPALWVHPVEHPLPVLAVPLAAGAALLVVGQLLNAAGAFWRRALGAWWRSDGAMLVLYLSLIGALFEPWLLSLAALGALWFVVGEATQGHGRALLAAGAAAAELLERTLQLVVNTLSFVRVGAFALAHAGLSIAVVSLADVAGAGLGGLLILIVGNLVIIALEGLVVSVQTTRLILFEFFVRFLRAGGRSFRPLPAPSLLPQPIRRRVS